jgi:hypothetical protein
MEGHLDADDCRGNGHRRAGEHRLRGRAGVAADRHGWRYQHREYE